MNKIFKSLVVASLALVATASVAQNTESAYFLDGHIYRHELNPAFGNDMNYVSMPFLGNMQVGFRGNLHLNEVLFPVNGQTVTFMHPDVKKDKVMEGISDHNDINQELRLQLLSIGFKGIGGYNTIGINVRENANMTLPGAAFSLLKEGITNKNYNLTDVASHADAMVEIALGHSHKINDKWTVGGKLKFLLGAGNADLIVNSANLNLGADGKYYANVNGKAEVNFKGAEFIENPFTNKIEDFTVNTPGLSGFGVAFDLGAEYKINDNFRVSGSILDLGFVNWNTNLTASIKGNKNVNLGDYSYNVDENKYTNGVQSIEDAFDDLADAFELKAEGDKGSVTKGLGVTFNIGGEYKAHFYDKLTFGLLNTTRIDGPFSWTNFRLSANVAPIKQISAGINFSAGTYGVGFGWIIDFHPRGFGLFLAMDNTIGKLSKQGIPLNSNAEFSMGINFPF